MPEKKKSGLHKDISSIFSGLEEVDDGRAADQVPAPSPPEPKEWKPESLPPRPSPTAVSEEITVEGAFPARRNAWIGLDIGRSSIKLVQLYPVTGGWEIGGYALKEIRMETDAEDLEKKEYLVRNLKKLIAEIRAQNQLYVSSLRGSGISTNLIPLPRMPKGELASACRLEAKRRVSFNIDKAFIQSQLPPEETARPGGKLNYIVTVARRETVARRLSILQEAGLQVSSLLPLPFAWKDFLNDFISPNAGSVTAVIDIGSDRTLVSIFRGSQLQFSREFETGGDHVNEAIIQAGLSFREKVDISWEEAERFKKEKSLFQAGADDNLKGNLRVSHMISMVRPVLERIVQESKRSLEYYVQLFRDQEVNRVYLSGGGALPSGFASFFQERLKVPVALLRFPQQINLHHSISGRKQLEELFPRLAKAAALSLSRRWEINFVPPLDKILQNVLRKKTAILILAVVLFGISFMFYQSKARLVPLAQQKVSAKEEQLKRIQNELGVYSVLADLQDRLTARERLGKYSSLRQPNWRGVLKEIGRIIPDDIILSRIVLIEGTRPLRLSCEGRVIKTEASLPSTVTDFIVKVENSPFFREVEKITEDVEEGKFEFNCTLVY